MVVILVVITIFAYALGVKFEFEHRFTTEEERNQMFKLIPSQLVLLTIPINVGHAVNPGSVVRHIPENVREGVILAIVIFAIIVYLACFSQGKHLHRADFSSRLGTGANKAKLVFQYVLAGFFVVSSVCAGVF